MISAEVGGSENVNGKQDRDGGERPMPGSTPTSVPISTPMKQKRRFAARRRVKPEREIGDQVHGLYQFLRSVAFLDVEINLITDFA